MGNLVLGILSDLSLSPIQKIASEFIPGLLNLGLSSNGILSTLSNNGMGLNRAKGLSLIRFFQNQGAGLDYYKLLNKTSYPDPARLPETTTPIQSNYIWKIHVLGYDEDRGQKVNFWQTISSDSLITKTQAESAYYAAYLDAETDRYLTLTSFNAEEGYRNIAVAATL